MSKAQQSKTLYCVDYSGYHGCDKEGEHQEHVHNKFAALVDVVVARESDNGVTDEILHCTTHTGIFGDNVLG